MSGSEFKGPSVAGAEGGWEARQYEDDQAPSPSFEVPRLLREGDFVELEPAQDADIWYYYHADIEDLRALVIRFRWAGIVRELSIVEYIDYGLADIALEVRLDGQIVAILPERGETPWFLERDDLLEAIAKDRAATLVDILRYLAWPFNSLAEDLASEGGREP